MADVLGSLFVQLKADDTDLVSSIDGAEQSIQGTAKRLTDIGGKLTAAVTIPIVGIGAALVKVASDAEEVENKFRTAFRGIEDQATQSAQALAESYGLSNTEAQKLLANTGDLLKGFGATSQEALDLSEQVQQLAADLGSYNNLPTAQASEAITKALLGERESLKSLGVVVSEEAVKRQLAINGTDELTGQLLLQAKAQATLQLITQQSGDAIGDFSRSSDSAANQLKILQGEFVDLAVDIGELLLPVAKDIISFARDIVEGFANLSVGNQQLILTLAGIAAAAGPVIASIGAISGALTFLAANPITLVIGALAGLVIAYQAYQNEQEENLRLTVEQQEENLKLADTQNKLAQENQKSARAIDTLIESGKNVDEVLKDNKQFVDDLEEAYPELTRRVLENAVANGQLADELRNIDIKRAEEALRTLREEAKELQAGLEDALGTDVGSVGILGGRNVAIELQLNEREAVENFDKALTELVQDFQANGGRLSEALKQELIANSTGFERDFNDPLLDSFDELEIAVLALGDSFGGNIDKASPTIREFAKTVTESGGEVAELTRAIQENEAAQAIQLDTIEGTRSTAGDILLLNKQLNEQIQANTQSTNENTEAEQRNRREQELIADAIARRIELNEENSQRLFEQGASQIAILAQQRDEEIRIAEEAGAETFAIRAFYDEEIRKLREENLEDAKQKAEEEAQFIIDTGFDLLSGVQELFSSLNDLSQAQTDSRIQDLENQKNKGIDSLQEQLDQNLISQADFDAQSALLEEEFEKNKKEG
jgi:hypothetical protein